jgi:hypothetical protein
LALSIILLAGCTAGEKAPGDSGAQEPADGGIIADSGPPTPPDRDFDGLEDALDPWPDDRCCTTDLDGDGICDGRDFDRDGDGWDDYIEYLLGTSDLDKTSKPGITRQTDCAAVNPGIDSDSDGYPDRVECAAGSDPLSPRSIPGALSRQPDRCDFGAGKTGPFWLKGDLHMHTTYSGDAAKSGGDNVAGTIKIAEWFGDPRMTAIHPEYEGRGLDFMAITDHRVADAFFDKDFFSNRILLLQAEEFGGDGHANVFGISTVISDTPASGETPTEAIARAFRLAERQGGVFSINHPMLRADYWHWNVTAHKACEIWNVAWGVPLEMVTAEDLDRKKRENGGINHLIGTALVWSKGLKAGMHVKFWEAGLTAGLNTAPVGGSDRHELFMPGYPTTWVLAEQYTASGIIDGISKRHTVVSRSPAGPHLEAVIEKGPKRLLAGDPGLLSEFAGSSVKVRVTRAPGGMLEFVEGSILDTNDPAVLAGAPEPGVAGTLPIPDADEAVLEFPWNPSKPSWLYVRVLEKINLDDYGPKSRPLIEQFFAGLESGGGGGLGDLVMVMLPFVDEEWVMHPDTGTCTQRKLSPGRMECVPVDTTPLGTFFMDEPLNRAFNVVMRDGKVTRYAMGAVTGAFMLR